MITALVSLGWVCLVAGAVLVVVGQAGDGAASARRLRL